VVENPRFGQGNPRKSKFFPNQNPNEFSGGKMFSLGWLGMIWVWLGKAWRVWALA
jgi:hypothetical protein